MSQSSGAYGEADATEQKNEQHNNQPANSASTDATLNARAKSPKSKGPNKWIIAIIAVIAVVAIAPTKRYERSRSPSVRRNSIRLRCLTPSRCIGSWSKLNRYFGYPSASFVNGRNSRSSTLGSCTLIDTCT